MPYTLICYDITDNGRRAKLHTLLLGYGAPVQRSVFECDISQRQLKTLRARAAELINPRRDSLRFYHLCGRCQKLTETAGTELAARGENEDYVV